jgi:uncharacterized membrane protein
MQLTPFIASLIVPPNDWQIKQLTGLSAFLLLLVLVLTALASFGLHVPAITEVAAFLFFTFIPGLLLLRILRIHNTGFIECLGYAVGLSLALDMAVMVAINFMLPAAGISQPITAVPLSIAFAVITAILILFVYLRDHAFAPPPPEKPSIHWPPILLLILLLASTILAAKIADTQSNNTLLVICLIAIAAIVLMAALGRFIRPSQYPFAIFIISLCLLYQTTLQTPYLIGSDIYTEYAYYNLVSISGIWDPNTTGIVNSCLSITMLAPLYSIFMNIPGVWVFKAVYPLIFALMPVVLFKVFRLQSGPRVSFLAVFFFLAVPTFSLELISLCRQQVAELFLVLVILLLVERRLRILPKALMLIIFAAGIIVSHYGIGTIGLIYIALLAPLVLIIISKWFRRLWSWLSRGEPGLPCGSPGLPTWAMIIFVAFFIAAGLYWFFITSSGINFTRLLDFLNKHSRDIVAGIFQIQPADNSTVGLAVLSARDALIRTALGMDFLSVSLQGKIFRIFQYTTQLLLVLGILRFIFRPGGYKFSPEFLAFSLTSVMLLAACIILPGFAERFNTTRIYHLALLTLAPFLVIGCQAVVHFLILIRKFIERRRPDTERVQSAVTEHSASFIAVAVLVPYFIFCSGLVFEISGQKVTDRIDTPYSIALSRYRLDLTSSFSSKDGAAAHWLSSRTTDGTIIFTDHHAGLILQINSVPGRRQTLEPSMVSLPTNSFIWLTEWNASSNELTYAIAPGLRKYVSTTELPLFKNFTGNLNTIYNNCGAKVLISVTK